MIPVRDVWESRTWERSRNPWQISLSRRPSIVAFFRGIWRALGSALRLQPTTVAHATLYYVKNSFHPIRNTSAVVLTDTVSPEERADLPLLDCGGNTLLTVHNQVVIRFLFNQLTDRFPAKRTSDFTHCDAENLPSWVNSLSRVRSLLANKQPIASNVLLATITGNELSEQVLSKIWNCSPTSSSTESRINS